MISCYRHQNNSLYEFIYDHGAQLLISNTQIITLVSCYVSIYMIMVVLRGYIYYIYDHSNVSIYIHDHSNNARIITLVSCYVSIYMIMVVLREYIYYIYDHWNVSIYRYIYIYIYIYDHSNNARIITLISCYRHQNNSWCEYIYDHGA